MTAKRFARHTLLLVTFALSAATGVQAAPFPTRDQNPFLTVFGMPTPLPARLSRDPWSVALDFNVANTAAVQRAPGEQLIADAETRELRLSVGRTFGERWAVRLELPYRYVGSGTFDGFIEDYHDTFGLPNGDRDVLRDDRLWLSYERAGEVLFEQRSSTQGLADVVLSGGYQWLTTSRTAVSLWVSIKVPTGTASKLTGSGATDVTLAVAAERTFASRWKVFGQVAVSRLGNGEVLPRLQREVLPSVFAGTAYRVTNRFELQLQLDYHGAAFESTALSYLKSALLLTVGGRYELENGWRFELGLSEDIEVEASPDATLSLGLRRDF